MKQSKHWFAGNIEAGTTKNIKPFLDSWKHCVGKNDTVFILGDLAITKQKYWISVFAEMPGWKVLLKGDKDKNRDSWYEKLCFDMVVPFNHSLTVCHDYGKILLSNIPARPNVMEQDSKYKNLAFKFYKKLKREEYILNIHSLTAGKGNEHKDTFDVSLENINGCLVELENIIERKFK